MKFEKLRQAVEGYTLLDTERIRSLWNLTNDLNRREIIGDIVECGSSKGGSSAVLRACMGKYRKLWIYDSFEGMPETCELDGDEAKKWIGSCSASEHEVVEILKITGAFQEEFVILSGLFQDTFNQALPNKVALLHCDVDWYKSVTIVLETFYPLMSEGACVILDDFGYWEGCRLAFYDFCEKFHVRPLLERVGNTQAFWIKGKEHNRNG